MHQSSPFNLGPDGADVSLLGLRLWLQQAGATTAADASAASIVALSHGSVVVTGLPDAPAGGEYTVELYLLADPDRSLRLESWGPGPVAAPAPSFVQARIKVVGPARIVAGKNAPPVQLVANTDADPSGLAASFALYARGVATPVLADQAASVAYSGVSPAWRLTLSWSPDPSSTAALAPGWHFGRFTLLPSGGGELPMPADDSLAIYLAGAA